MGRLFYAFGTGLGGIIGPTLFGQLIQTQQRSSLLIGYLIGAALMGVAEGVQAVWGGGGAPGVGTGGQAVVAGWGSKGMTIPSPVFQRPLRLLFSDDSNDARPRNDAAWRDPGGAPNHDGPLLGGLALCANYLCARRPGANRLGASRLYDRANGRHANIGRHGQVTVPSAGRPCWPGSAKGSPQTGQAPERR